MILGIGADIVEIKRLKGVIKKTPTMIERVFTQNEREKAKKLKNEQKIAYYAKRFAGKEALAKACGTGIGADINWQDIEILNDKKGKPVVNLSSRAVKYLSKQFKTKKIKSFISLSDETEFALAFVILTK